LSLDAADRRMFGFVDARPRNLAERSWPGDPAGRLRGGRPWSIRHPMSVETTAHRRLKALSIRFLRRWGGQAVATEVRAPLSRYRVDAAGWLDGPPEPAIGGAPGSGSE